MEDNLNILVNGNDLNKLMQPKTTKNKAMVVAPLRVT